MLAWFAICLSVFRCAALAPVVNPLVLSGPAHGQELWRAKARKDISIEHSRDLTSDCAVYIRAVLDRYHEVLAAHCPHTEAPNPRVGWSGPGLRSSAPDRAGPSGGPAAATTADRLRDLPDTTLGINPVHLIDVIQVDALQL